MIILRWLKKNSSPSIAATGMAIDENSGIASKPTVMLASSASVPTSYLPFLFTSIMMS